ncbi:MAG: acetylxylan esterase [Kiritimatiellae bacterium]|nr:acetylxylan esterase [Kiritimatiellia bacterium]
MYVRFTFAVSFAACCLFADETVWLRQLEKAMLPTGKQSFCRSVFNRLEEADYAADAAWRETRSPEAFAARQREMRDRMIAAIGGLPERTPLNAKTVAVIPRKGYRIEKVLFESLPGIYVTGLLYLPDATAFPGPRPAFALTCGHSGNGKGAADYQRACVIAAHAGIASFIYDPMEQGERPQTKRGPGVCGGHNRIGVCASLLGWSMARFRIWDAMRVFDYLASRPEIRADRLGMMGNSGGGTMTSLVMALEPRIRAAAPSCYLTSLREVCEHMGPQDAEQNIFGQLAFGLNHAGYILLQAPMAVCVCCCHDDMFTFKGTMDTFRTVHAAVDPLGWSERFAMADVPGPHGWKESIRTASVAWMRRWLADDAAAIPLKMPEYRMLDADFNIKSVDHGLDAPAYHVTPNGRVLDLPGARSVYDLMRDELAAVLKTRNGAPDLTAVRRLCGIRPLADIAPMEKLLSQSVTNNVTVERRIFAYPDGLAIPTVTFVPTGVKAGPVLCLGENMTSLAKTVETHLTAGAPVTVASLRGFGETSQGRYRFYGAQNADEESAVMLYLLGESLVASRAEDALAVAAWMRARFNTPVALDAHKRAAIPAAHAFALERGIFRSLKLTEAPKSWTAVVQNGLPYPFADSVNGALRLYDWTDLAAAGTSERK